MGRFICWHFKVWILQLPKKPSVFERGEIGVRYVDLIHGKPPHTDRIHSQDVLPKRSAQLVRKHLRQWDGDDGATECQHWIYFLQSKFTDSITVFGRNLTIFQKVTNGQSEYIIKVPLS